MKAAIIAAGRGERLALDGIALPKPLVPVRDTPLIARIIYAAARINADSVACIVNGLSPTVHTYLAGTQWPVPVEITRKTTNNSLESLFQLAPALRAEPFLLFTVDTVFALSTLKRFLAGAQTFPAAGGVLALTRYIEDERPLLVELTRDRRITAIGDAVSNALYATAGFYYLRPDIFDYQDLAVDRRLGSLRQFLSLLVEEGYPLYGIRVSKTIDVDHAADIDAAEAYMRRRAYGTR